MNIKEKGTGSYDDIQVLILNRLCFFHLVFSIVLLILQYRAFSFSVFIGLIPMSLREEGFISDHGRLAVLWFLGLLGEHQWGRCSGVTWLTS